MKMAETPVKAPYGTWASPISAESLAKGAIGVSDLRTEGGRLFWLENRPDQAGRMVAMTGDAAEARQLTPDRFSVRTRVHEYGGASYVVVGETLYFSNFTDQLLYAQRFGDDPDAITPTGYRYADAVAAPRRRLICVREDHTDPAECSQRHRRLSGTRRTTPAQCCSATATSSPTRGSSPDGRRLAWIAWDHPNMPWDDTRLYVADLGTAGWRISTTVAGGATEIGDRAAVGDRRHAVFHLRPQRFLEPLRRQDGETRADPAAKDAEFAGPLWGLGQSNYALMADGRIVATYGDARGDHLVVIEPATDARDRPALHRHRRPARARRPHRGHVGGVGAADRRGNDRRYRHRRRPGHPPPLPGHDRAALHLATPRRSPFPAPAGWTRMRSTTPRPTATSARPTANAAADRAGARRPDRQAPRRRSAWPTSSGPAAASPSSTSTTAARPATAAPIASG